MSNILYGCERCNEFQSKNNKLEKRVAVKDKVISRVFEQGQCCVCPNRESGCKIINGGESKDCIKMFIKWATTELEQGKGK